MKPVKNKFHLDFPVSPQEEFAVVVARAVVELVVELVETQSRHQRHCGGGLAI
jgi:hypothetical protein